MGIVTSALLQSTGESESSLTSYPTIQGRTRPSLDDAWFASDWRGERPQGYLLKSRVDRLSISRSAYGCTMRRRLGDEKPGTFDARLELYFVVFCPPNAARGAAFVFVDP